MNSTNPIDSMNAVLAVDDSSAEELFAVVQSDNLTRGDGTLRLGKVDGETSFFNATKVTGTAGER